MTEPTTACRTGRHRICGGFRCSCSCHPGTPEQRETAGRKAAADALNELVEVTESRGRHEGHTLRQAGRCVCCSCGYRYQGRIPRAEGS